MKPAPPPNPYAAGMEAAAKIAEATTAYDDGLQKSAGCFTTGQRIARVIREAAKTPPRED